MMSKLTVRFSLALLPLCLCACATGPDYVRPKLDLPTQYKEDAGWKTATPRDTEARGNWWEIYGNSELNGLMPQLRINNQNVAQAEAAYRQAQALTQQARAGYFPTITATADASKNHSSGGSSTTTSGSSHALALNASWAPDVWGKVRRQVEAGNAAEQASAADLAAALLSAQGELAADYFQLRVVDAQAALLDKTVTAYQRSLQITRNQYAAGIVTRADVAQAETQALSTQAALLDLGVQRAQLEHAIALLLGQAPERFSLPVAPLQASLPGIPASGLPSDLLERRPDIAAAERRVAAANADIGVARSAYFPALTLSGSAGLQGAGLTQWLDAPTRVWSLGAGLAQTLFQGGLQKAATAAAVAAYDGTVAQYRQTVLGDLQEVEDNLATLRVLEQEATVQAAAVKAAEDAASLAMNQYKAGTTSYLTVATAQATALSNERAALNITSRQFAAHVLLIEGLGGSAPAK
jgi:NodT family efflux transporter outer membrane factor (OMF) lipoprotein